MRYYMSGLLLIVCFAIGWKLGQTKPAPPGVDLEVQELSIDLGDFNESIEVDSDPASDINPGFLGDPSRRS